MSFTHTTVALAWLLVALNFVGLGALLLRAGVPGSPPSLRAAFWVGWAGWIGALECIHFFVPLGSAGVSLPLVLAGAFGLVWNAGPWWQAIRDSLREHPRAWGACLLFALWLANRSLGPLMTIDAGLYHLGSIQWASEHPLVGGLANLHGRLAFNSTAFLWMASLDPLFESLRGFHFAASLLVLVAVVERVTRALGTRDVVRRRFELCMLLPLGYAATVIHLSSTNPDWIVLVLGTVAASALLDLLSPGDAHERDETLVALAALAAVGVTVKLSFAVLAGAIGFTVITRLARSTPRPTHRARVVATMLVVWLAVPWLLRGVELSGYPAYPLSLLAPGVAWQVPEERARGEVDWVRSWARDPERTPEEVLADSSWLGPWLRARVRQSDSIALLLFPATLALASLGLSLGLSLRRNRVDANPPHSPAPHPPDPRSFPMAWPSAPGSRRPPTRGSSGPRSGFPPHGGPRARSRYWRRSAHALSPARSSFRVSCSTARGSPTNSTPGGSTPGVPPSPRESKHAPSPPEPGSHSTCPSRASCVGKHRFRAPPTPHHGWGCATPTIPGVDTNSSAIPRHPSRDLPLHAG